MGRKRKGRVLDVYVGSSKVGRYSREPSGATSFRYDPEWLSSERAFPVSLSMPLSDRVWSGESATSYFDGLLPDDCIVRETRWHRVLDVYVGSSKVGRYYHEPSGATLFRFDNGATTAKLDTVIRVLAALDMDLSIVPRRKARFDPTEY